MDEEELQVGSYLRRARLRKMTDEQRKSHGGPPEEYPQRIRDAILHVPFEAINWIAFPDVQLRELVEYLGGNPNQASRRKLQAEARQVVYRFQRSHGQHRRGPDLVKIAPALGPPKSSAVEIAQKKRAWR